MSSSATKVAKMLFGYVISFWLLQCSLVWAYSAKRFEIVLLTNNTSLTCFSCETGDHTDCVTMANASGIPSQVCTGEDIYCRVRRMQYYRSVHVLQRGCANKCNQGCWKTGAYVHCESCCNDRSFCNVGQYATGLRSSLGPVLLLLFTLFGFVFFQQFS